jgi:hypothetical protein
MYDNKWLLNLEECPEFLFLSTPTPAAAKALGQKMREFNWPGA